jgi:hypothetical protein
MCATRDRAAGAPYEWVGFYLPAPCHRDDSWSGKRETLAELGFGTAVIYVGRQTWGGTPKPGSPAAQGAQHAGKRCDVDFVSGPRGDAEGADAIARTAAEGFGRGTIVYLDVERTEPGGGTARRDVPSGRSAARGPSLSPASAR